MRVIVNKITLNGMGNREKTCKFYENVNHLTVIKDEKFGGYIRLELDNIKEIYQKIDPVFHINYHISYHPVLDDTSVYKEHHSSLLDVFESFNDMIYEIVTRYRPDEFTNEDESVLIVNVDYIEGKLEFLYESGYYRSYTDPHEYAKVLAHNAMTYCEAGDKSHTKFDEYKKAYEEALEEIKIDKEM